MPELKNKKHEEFATLRAGGCTLGAAYATAFGFETELRQHAAHGSRLSKRPLVAARLEEKLPETAVASTEDLDPEFVIQNLLQVLQKAVDSGKFSSANRTLELLGKFQGMFNDRRNDRRERETDLPDFDGMTPEKIFNYFRRSMADANPSWVLIDKRAPMGAEGNRDELVAHYRTQLRNIDPEIRVLDPKEVQAEPPEDGGTAGSALH